MTDLEKMIRNALDSGETSGEVAQRLGDLLNKVEREKREEDAKKAKAAEEAKANAKQERDDFVDECVSGFEDRWEDINEKLSARDAAIVALVVAMQNKANEGWTLDEVKEFVDSMTSCVQLNLDMREGSLDPKAKGERAFKLVAKSIGEALDEAGIKSRIERFPFDGMFQRMAEASKDATRRPGDALQEWLNKQGW